mgnify:CR=1 FL=1
MIITESQLRKIIQEETQTVLHEQILRELREGVLNEGVKDVLQDLVQKYGKKAVMAAVAGSIALGSMAPGAAMADPGGVAAQLAQMQTARERAPTAVAQAEADGGSALVQIGDQQMEVDIAQADLEFGRGTTDQMRQEQALQIYTDFLNSVNKTMDQAGNTAQNVNSIIAALSH